MEAHLGPYLAVLVALAVLLWPVFFYLWFKWYVEKHFGPFDNNADRSAPYDRRSELKQARRSLQRFIRWRTGAVGKGLL
jgi:hypothetical protein